METENRVLGQRDAVWRGKTAELSEESHLSKTSVDSAVRVHVGPSELFMCHFNVHSGFWFKKTRIGMRFSGSIGIHWNDMTLLMSKALCRRLKQIIQLEGFYH